MVHTTLRALAWALLALEASCLGGRPSCSESAIYEGWPKTKWDEMYVTGRPPPNYAGCTTVNLEGADLEADEVLQLCTAMTSNANAALQSLQSVLRLNGKARGSTSLTRQATQTSAAKLSGSFQW